MKNITEIKILLANKSFVITNESDFLKFVLKISPYLPIDSQNSLSSLLKIAKGSLPIYLRFKSGLSPLVYYDGWSEMENYNKYNNPKHFERIDNLTPYLEML